MGGRTITQPTETTGRQPVPPAIAERARDMCETSDGEYCDGPGDQCQGECLAVWTARILMGVG